MQHQKGKKKLKEEKKIKCVFSVYREIKANIQERKKSLMSLCFRYMFICMLAFCKCVRVCVREIVKGKNQYMHESDKADSYIYNH